MSRFSKRSKYCPIERFNYLKQLLHEFNVTPSIDAKEQVIANLANFAYHPINYQHLRKLGVISVFLDLLDHCNNKLVVFSIKGLCNLASDGDNCKVIKHLAGLSKIEDCLFKDEADIIIPALGSLVLMKEKVTRTDVQLRIEHLCNHSDKRVSNLAKILSES